MLKNSLMPFLVFLFIMASKPFLTSIVNSFYFVWGKKKSGKHPILQEIDLAERRHHIHALARCVPGEENMMADVASRLTHLPGRQFLSHFRTNFPQSKPWNMLPLPSVYNQQVTTMLHSKQYLRDSPSQSSRNIPQPVTNGGASTADCTFPLTSKATKTLFHSPEKKFRVSVMGFYIHRWSVSRRNWSSNTSAPLVKYLHS